MAEPSPKSPLQVGILVDDLIQPAWVTSILSELLQTGQVNFRYVIQVEPAANQQPAGWVYSLYSKLDNRAFPLNADALLPFSLANVLPDIPVIRWQVDAPIPVSDSVIPESEPDIILSFINALPPARLAGDARYGVWFIRHHTGTAAEVIPPGFWSVMDQNPVTSSLLWMVRGDPPHATVIMQHSSATVYKSTRLNANHILWASGVLLRKKIHDVWEQGEVGLFHSDMDQTIKPIDLSNRRLDGNLQIASRILRVFLSRMLHKLESFLYYEQFRLGMGETAEVTDLPTAIARGKELFPPEQLSWADPFLFQHEGKMHLFYEEWKDEQKGILAVVEINADGEVIGNPRKVLERSYHLSYPFVFAYQGNIYMMPETGQNRTVELYCCTQYPEQWEFHSVLLQDINAVDATLLENNGRWWMFVNTAKENRDGEDNYDELHIYFADSPFGPWNAHPLNPVKSDVCSARSAGRVFEENGALYRPSQDGSVRYGYAVTLNRILELSETAYSEVETGKLLPDWKPGLLGIHTLNFAGNLMVFDVLAKRLRWQK